MSSSGGAGGARVSIPNHARKTIQYIKEIASNHSDEEIYTMLRECSMDPNETVQKLLYQDTFHEVKRKRDKRKENFSNREQPDSTWRAGVQGRGGRGGRGNYSSRYIPNDAGGTKDLNAGKEGVGQQGLEKGSRSNAMQDMENKSSLATNSIPGITNGPVKAATAMLSDGPMPAVGTNLSSAVEGTHPLWERKTESAMTPTIDAVVGHTVDAIRDSPALSLQQYSAPTPSAVNALVSDPVLSPSNKSSHQCAVDTMRREPVAQKSSNEPISQRGGSNVTVGPDMLFSSDENVGNEAGNANPADMSGKSSSKPQINDANLMHEVSETITAVNAGSSDSRPSSNYSNCSVQLVGSQKVGVNKEWKPKQTKSAIQPIGRAESPDMSPTPTDMTKSLPVSDTASADTTASHLQEKLADLSLSDSQHVIFPNHIRIPDAERAGLSFGSFSANFIVKSSLKNDPDTENVLTPTQAHEGLEDNNDVQDISSGCQNASVTVHEDASPDHTESSRQINEIVSTDTDMSGTAQEFDQSKSESAPIPSAPQYPLVRSPPAYSSFGLMAPVLGSQLSGFENSETQTRDPSRVPGFVVPQPFDQSANYYTQMYRTAADGDGHLSPYLVPSTAKYNGNSAVLPNPSVQSPQESGNGPVQSTSGPAPVGTQGSGVMQTSIPLAQQSVPIFRQPPGVHLSHYPPNYMPYSQYFPSFYIPPPALHPFLSNAAFPPQQHPASGIYPPPVPGGAAPLKYSMSQFKSGANTGNSINTGVAAGYGLYSSTSTGYSPSPATSTINSTNNEDLTGSQYKENSGYIPGQQSEGSTVWIPAGGRDLSGLQGNSYYNMSPQGQHMTFTPSQTGHGTFPGVYHAAQTMANPVVHPLIQQSQAVAGAVEMVGPPAGVYQHHNVHK